MVCLERPRLFALNISCYVLDIPLWLVLLPAHFNEDELWIVRIQMSLPIINRFNTKDEASLYYHQKLGLLHQLYQEEEKLTQSISQLSNSLKQQNEAYEALSQEVRLGKEYVGHVQKKVDLGQSSHLDLLQAMSDAEDSETDFIDAHVNWLITCLQLDYQLGRLEF